jgi:maltokinase
VQDGRVAEDLGGQIGTWLVRQRWFAGKGRPVAAVEVDADVHLGGGLRHLIVAVRFDDGDPDHRYQTPLFIAAEQHPDCEHWLVGRLDGGYAYDAPHLPAGAEALLRLIAGNAGGGGIRGHAVGDVELLAGHAVGVEQSNTSVVYGDRFILKLFRRLAPGVNPDLEVTRALAEAGSTRVAAPLGWIEGSVAGEPTTLAVLQAFLRHGAEGWKLAVASVRDLYAEGDLHPDEVGGDFASESERLGAATAEVHTTLARVLPSRLARPQESQATAAQLHARLDAALEVVAELRPHAEGVRAAYDAVGGRTDPVPVQRVHGDLHLGQVLRTDSGWVLLDFEGEPARPLAERTALMSPLRDVAGMLRSYDYAARVLLMDRPEARHLAYRATEWTDRNVTAYCDGYAAAAGADPREEATLLRAFVLDKAVYEVVYEARHRPSWLAIPLGSVERLAGSS